MGLKIFMASFMVSSILFFLIFIPTRLTIQLSSLRSAVNYMSVPKNSLAYPVTFAYLISASKGDVGKLKRLMRVLYHPGNYYLIHVDYGAPEAEHREVAEYVASDPVFGQVGNVWVVGKPNLVTYRGPTMLATTLHAMAMLLRTCQWDWFINLSASDYPLVTQDDLIQVFSELPRRDINFIQHSSQLGWKLNKRGKPMIIDPGLYSLNKSEIWWVIKQRSLPTSFKLYTGSAWTILSRSFAEYCIVGWENLPRTLLLYYTNFVSSPEGYFQTVICNSEDYKNTTVNHDLHYITWDNPPKQHPRSLGLKDYRKMVLSSRPFARKFKRNDPVLDKIDRDLLKRYHGQFSFGGWCSQGGKHRACSALRTENYGVLNPGPASRRLKNFLTKLLSDKFFHKQQCRRNNRLMSCHVDLIKRGSKAVSDTALTIVASMKRDWMQTGRKPSGLCGAALYISAFAHGIKCSKPDILRIVHVCEATLTKRLVEFENTKCSSLTVEELDTLAKEQENNPTVMAEGELKGVTSKDLLCEHKDSGASHFALGLCEECYKDLDKLSGGLGGGSDPPAFQRAEREREKRALLKESVDEACDLANASNDQFKSHREDLPVPEGANVAHESIKDGEYDDSFREDESETLSDIDDEDVDLYIHDEKERKIKKILWEAVNREYLEEQAAKEALAAANKKAFEANFENCSEDLLAPRELAASASEAVAKSRKGKTDDPKKGKKARFDPPLDNHDNLQSFEHKNDDEMGSMDEFEDDMGEMYQSGLSTDNIADTYFPEDDGYGYNDYDY